MKEKLKITDYSRDTFLQSGFYKITMDEIAKGLSISKKTIYKYFPSKNKLVDEVMFLFMNHVKGKITKSIEEQENSIGKIRALTQIFAELSLKLNQKILYDIQTYRPDLWGKIEEFRGKVIKEVWEDIINQGKKEGYIVDKPNDIIITLFYSGIQAVINPIFLINHNYSINEAFRLTFDILIKGFLTPEGLKVYNKIEHKNEIK
jgi:AcrR family transcriptional regulator